MPKDKAGKHYPYTPSGRAAAKKANAAMTKKKKKKGKR